jgi:Ca2+-binding RTX toxin-like protein
MASRLRLGISVLVLVLAAVLLPATPGHAGHQGTQRPKAPAVTRTGAQYVAESSADGGDDGTEDDDGCDESNSFGLVKHFPCSSSDSGPMGAADSALRIDAVITAPNGNVTKIVASGFANAHATTNSGVLVGHGGRGSAFAELNIHLQAATTVPYRLQYSLSVAAANHTDCAQGELSFENLGTSVSAGNGCVQAEPDQASLDVETTMGSGPKDLEIQFSTGGVEKTTPGPGTRSAETHFSVTLTLKAACTIAGTDADDSGSEALIGTGGADVICGLGGSDVIDGLGGGDTIFGGPGNDVIQGGTGSDVIDGEAGNDTVSGNGDSDQIVGGPGNDGLFGFTEAAADISGDTIEGEGGNDTIIGSAGNDSLFGGPGFDLIRTVGDISATDTVRGGNETGAAPAGFACPKGDRIIGGSGVDKVNGDGGNDCITGGEGDDVLRGGDGADDLQGSADGDRLFGDDGPDRLQGQSGDDPQIDGGPKVDTYQGGSGDDTFFTRDGVKETVGGGQNHDEATVDRADVVESIEVVHRPPLA